MFNKIQVLMGICQLYVSMTFESSLDLILVRLSITYSILSYHLSKLLGSRSSLRLFLN
jgi:hypothetical protein